MKRRIIQSLVIPLAAIAGVPIEWNVDVTRVEPVRVDAYHGETLDLTATLRKGGRPLDVPAGSATFLWQTNGMGAAWWQTNATVSADGVVRGAFGPAMDTGADAVRFFFSVVSGSGANYRAAGTIALRPSPGATPTTADLASQTAINFADYQLVNAPWVTAGDAAEAVRAATNALATALQASDNALSSAIADAAQAATNYADSVAAAGDAALAAATNAVSEAGRAALVASATSSSNYTDAAVAAIDIPSLTGYATEAWVQGRGYLTDHQSLSGYATESWTRQAISNALPVVPSLAGYATEAWVTNRGYLTEHQPLTGYATEAWVQGRNYLTEHQSLAGYATEAWVQGRGYLTEHQSLAGYATEAWVQSRNYLTEHQPLSGYATETYAQSAAAGAQAAAESYARSLAWATSAGNTRLVSLDGATWQDATGTVWQVSAVYGWAGTVVDLATTTARSIQFDPVPGSNGVWTAGNGTNMVYDASGMHTYYLDFGEWTSYEVNDAPLSATNLTFNTAYDLYSLFYRPVSLVTNPVDHVLYASSGVSDRAMRSIQGVEHVGDIVTVTNFPDDIGFDYRSGITFDFSDGGDGIPYTAYLRPQGWWADSSFSWFLPLPKTSSYPYDVLLAAHDEIEEAALSATNYTDTVSSELSNNVMRAVSARQAALPYPTNAIPYSVVTGAAPASIVPVLTSVSNDAATAKLNSETALRIVLGESVWFAVTNFMRTAEGVIPSLQLWEVRDGATNLVYDSREEITNTVRALTQELRDDMTNRIHGVSNAIPSKAWGNYQSDGTDNPQPGEVAIINQPTVILTGGGTFNKYVTVGDSSVWVLKSSGPVSFGGNTNGNFFAVLDDEGNTHFKVAKTDSYDLPMFVSDILPRQSQNHIFVYTATTNRQGNAVPQPVLLAADDLEESAWYEEAEGEIDALGLTVSWAKDETIPAWVATITPDVWHEKMFFRAKVTQEGGAAVINTAPVRFDGGVQIGNGTYRLVPYTTGGKTYLTVEGMP